MSAQPFLVRQAFDDFDAYSEAVEDVADTRYTMPKMDVSRWTISHLALPGSMHVQLTFEGGGLIAEGAARPDGYFLIRAREGVARCNGSIIGPGDLVTIRPSAEFCLSMDGAHEWVSVFIPSAIADAAGLAPILGAADAKGADVVPVCDGEEGAVWQLVDRFVSLATSHQAIAEGPCALAEFERDLARCLVRAHAVRDPVMPRSKGRPSVIDIRLIAKAMELIEYTPDDPMTVPELAVAVGVSERSLREGFCKFLGIAPRHYIQLRRLHHARKVLLANEVGETTVAQVAADQGMWDLGRFAQRYKETFGELPSETLRR